MALSDHNDEVQWEWTRARQANTKGPQTSQDSSENRRTEYILLIRCTVRVILALLVCVKCETVLQSATLPRQNQNCTLCRRGAAWFRCKGVRGVFHTVQHPPVHLFVAMAFRDIAEHEVLHARIHDPL